jgi:DNA-binding NarL/FixJ family response regulator
MDRGRIKWGVAPEASNPFNAHMNAEAASESASIRVAIVEDDEFIRNSIAELLAVTPGFQCVGQFCDAESALSGLGSSNPDVVLVDIQLPGLSGVECVQKSKPTLPGVQFVMHTVYEDDQAVFDALAAGATGYLLKRTPHEKLLEAIREVRQGGSPMSGHIARLVVQAFQKRPQPAATTDVSAADPAWKLSPRELEILQALTRGYRYKEIADQCGISVETVRTHLRRIYEKLHVTSRTEAVVRFLGRS